MWKYGMTTRYFSWPPIVYAGFVHDSVWTTFAQRLPCVSIAPFGVPVVPPVYWRTARSSGPIGVRPRRMGLDGTSGSDPVAGSAKASVPSMRGVGVAAAEYSASDVTMTCSMDV